MNEQDSMQERCVLEERGANTEGCHQRWCEQINNVGESMHKCTRTDGQKGIGGIDAHGQTDKSTRTDGQKHTDRRTDLLIAVTHREGERMNDMGDK